MNLRNHKKQTLVITFAALTLSVLMIGLNTSPADTTLPPNSTAALQSSGMTSDANIYLYLEIDGNIIEGESAVSSLGRDKTIPIHSLKQEVYNPQDSSTGQYSSSRVYKPIVFTKDIDQTSPLLAKAFTNNETVDKAHFKFYRPDQSGSGAEEHFYSITLEAASIVALTTFISFSDSGDAYHLEEVSIYFQDITWTYEVSGATHRDGLRDFEHQ
jgi:type VI secretion system secreted protein Hcp